MRTETALKYVIFPAGIALTVAATAFLLLSRNTFDCSISQNQVVVRWKDQHYPACRRTWRGYCLWPFHRKHSTYKVTINDGIPIRDEDGNAIAVAAGKIRAWWTFDAATWNGFQNEHRRLRQFPDYEPIADNEIVVLVETRYRLLHNVEDTLRICVQGTDP